MCLLVEYWISKREMNTWLFQSLPENRDLRIELWEGAIKTWRVSRYRSQISPGDTVFFWMGGPSEIRGLYGWGEVVGSPRFDADKDQFRVEVVYRRRFEPPLLAWQIRSRADLDQMLIFRAPFGTNFPITPHEADTIAQLLPAADRPRL
jgi:predicted RNA-binding protein with PUA-like domain